MRWLEFYETLKIIWNLFFDFGQIQKRNYQDPIYDYDKPFGEKFKFRETWTEFVIFSKFHKFWTLWWMFPKFNPERRETLNSSLKTLKLDRLKFAGAKVYRNFSKKFETS